MEDAVHSAHVWMISPNNNKLLSLSFDDGGTPFETVEVMLRWIDNLNAIPFAAHESTARRSL